MMKTFHLTFLFFFIYSWVLSQSNTNPILFIYDASGSMWGQLEGKTKKQIAAEVLSNSIESLPEGQQIGLMAYGHRREKDCSDVEFIADLKNSDKSTVTNAIQQINPLGRTPLARSATMAIDQLRDAGVKATIILVTDGIESCDGDICQVITQAKADGIDFKLHIVGFGLKEGETEQLKCAAKAGDGHYYDANDAGGLSAVLNQATSEQVDELPTNFTFFASKNGEPVDAWVRAYKEGVKKEIDFGRTYQDSAHLSLPAGTYRLEILPLENTDLSKRIMEVTIEAVDEMQYLHVSFDAGKLEVSTTNNGEGWDATVRVYSVETNKVVSTTRTYGRSKVLEIDPGEYYIVFGAIKIKGEKAKFQSENVTIGGNQTKQIVHNFESGIVLIGAKAKDGALVDATVNITPLDSKKSIAAGRTYTSPNNNPRQFILNPGNYRVLLKAVGDYKGETASFEIQVDAKGSIEKIHTF